MTDENVPISVDFVNFTNGRVWPILQKRLEKIVTEEKDKCFTIEDEDERHAQFKRVKIAEDITGNIRRFVLNSIK